MSNPTDINNSVAKAELKVTYIIENELSAQLRIPHNGALAEKAGKDASMGAQEEGAILSVPLRVDAHQVASGWFVFAIDSDMIRDRTIAAHSIILEDTHGVSMETGPIMVRECIVLD